MGKGIGCIATEEILPGCLVLRERPALYLPPEEEEISSLLQRTITAFFGMTKGEQEIYNSQPEYYPRPNFGEGDYFGDKQKLTDYASKIDRMKKRQMQL